MPLTLIRWWTVKSQTITGARLQRLSEDIAAFMTDIKEQISSLQQAATPEPEVSNKHFQAPAASPLFTGMTVLLDQVEDAFGLVSYPCADSVVEISKFSDNLIPHPFPSVASTAVATFNRSHFEYGRMQKRFVIFGLGGSGKTEFCRKFAERNQPRWAK